MRAVLNRFLLTKLIAMAMVLLLVFSAAESYACGLEDAQQLQISQSQDNDAPSHEPTPDGLCVHGHCHHGSVAFPALPYALVALKVTETVVLIPAEPLAKPLASTLERPPKRA